MASIYSIRNRTSDLVYIGSTTNSLSRRLAQHRYKEMIVASCPTAYITRLETCSIEDRYIRERWWIERTLCVNYAIPSRSDKEYRTANQLHKKMYDILYVQRPERRIAKREINKRYREKRKLLAVS